MITNTAIENKLLVMIPNATELEMAAFRLGYKQAILDELEKENEIKKEILHNLKD